MPPTTTQTTWKVTITLPVVAVEVFLEAFDEQNNAVSCFEDEEAHCWKLAFHTPEKPEVQGIESKVEQLAKTLDIAIPPIDIEELASQNWVAESQKNFSSTIAGDFFVCATWHEEQAPQGKYIIRINPEQAFGTGGHETTSGCLMALSELASKGSSHKNILDLGCGSGILAIAMAKLWPTSTIMAVDIDPICVETSLKNAQLNGVVDHLQIGLSNGMDSATVQSGAPYELIVANILAEPLVEFATAICKTVEKGGHLILSGLLDTQEHDVSETYIAQGLDVSNIIPLGKWRTLVLSS